MKTVKFGGSSLANTEQFNKVINIINSDEKRRFVIPSAPGKSHADDIKVTDLLLLSHELVEKKQPLDSVWKSVVKRFTTIADELGCKLDLTSVLDEIKEKIINGISSDYVASRGECVNGMILADAIGAEFVDAAEIIRFKDNKTLDDITFKLIAEKCSDTSKKYVIPGFYGAKENGDIACFSRGGSDVTGALIANAMDCSIYENWTDVSGFLMCDPRIVESAKGIKEITYKELRELSYMGASVLHEDAVFPVREKNIPINIRNTNEANHPGTIIMSDRDAKNETIVGVAGKPGFIIFLIEKALMNNEIGFGRKVLGIFENYGVSYEHTPSGIDTLSVIVKEDSVNGKTEQILEDLQIVHPDNISVIKEIGLIATVGKGMNRNMGTAAKLFAALSDSKVNVRMIDQGSSEQNIIVGVEEKDMKTAIAAIYNKFVS